MNIVLTEAQKIIYLDVTGDLNYPDTVKLWDRIRRDHAHAHGALVRVGESTWTISSDEIRSLARNVHALPHIPWALVAGDAMTYGMLRMFVGWMVENSVGENFEVFRDADAGEEWVRTRMNLPAL